MSSEEGNGRRSTRLWMPVFAVIISFGVLAAVPAESAQGNKIPSGGKTAMALWALEVVADTLAVLWGSDDVVIARFFEIPMSEYERWPERWQNVLKEVHAAPEKFRRRTIHTLKMFDSADWELLEKMAPYNLGRTSSCQRILGGRPRRHQAR